MEAALVVYVVLAVLVMNLITGSSTEGNSSNCTGYNAL